jgi:hypothetical protein
LTAVEPLTDLRNELIEAIRRGPEVEDVETPPAAPPATGGNLLGRWYFEGRRDAFIEFFPDGTLVEQGGQQRSELTWWTEGNLIKTIEIDEFDFGEFSIRFSQSIDPVIGPYTTGYWIHFERSVFGSSSMGGFRYRQLDGDMGTMYGRWAVDVSSIMDNIANLEILPGGYGNRFTGPRDNRTSTPFTWRIEDGRFIRTVLHEGSINFEVDGDNLTIYELGDGWADIDRFTRTPN